MDLNDWRLAYDDKVLDFGTLESDYPFAVQMSISDAGVVYQDADHPNSDGRVMGRDLLRGLTLQFQGRIISDPTINPTKPWHTALDLYSAFVARWRDPDLRLVPGKYATLENRDRERMAVGRPRAIAPVTGNLRKGLIDFQFDFDTVLHTFLDSFERVALLSVEFPSGGVGLQDPLTDPLQTVGSSSAESPTVNDGDERGWPIIEFHGPGSGHGVDLYDADNRLLWSLKAPGRIKFDEVLTVNTRPWERSATINGAPGNGLLRGSTLEECYIPVGEFQLRYRVVDETGTSFAVVRWHDTYASL